MFKSCTLILALFLALPAAAQVYEWRDAEGRLNYSDQPPHGVEAKLIRPGRPSSAPTEGAAEASMPTLAERELEFRERRAEEAEAKAMAEQESRQAAERDRMCTQARNQLAALQSGQRVSRFNQSGEREYLDDVERTAEITRAQDFIRNNCE
ncbi:MAG TPA: DUF4124 domain-containing protein [Rhodocyclaceae bacterium]|nr:DUF4124 domain-containing protein [Rhodocyclaceae bacterium]HRQ46163.1 DUF4124 domain-containing protein [Rhodocyclaceae bacterium]